MPAYFPGKMILFVRSVLWDLGIPQEVATLLYEDNDACTNMENAQKPTPHTRHMDINVRRDPKVLRRVSRILIKEGLHFANLFYIFE